MLPPRESRSRECHRLDGLWRFRFDPSGAGTTGRWWRAPLPQTREMAVPASYNDLVTDAAEREHVGDVWYQRDVWVPAAWEGRRIVLRCDAAFMLRSCSTVVVQRISMTLLTGGTAVTLAGTLAELPAAAIAGTVVAGVGYGASGLATFGAMAKLAEPARPADRGALFAVAYTVAFLVFSLPAVAAGYATMQVGLHTTVAAYSVLVIGTALAAFAIHLARHRRPAGDRPA